MWITSLAEETRKCSRDADEGGPKEPVAQLDSAATEVEREQKCGHKRARKCSKDAAEDGQKAPARAVCEGQCARGSRTWGALQSRETGGAHGAGNDGGIGVPARTYSKATEINFERTEQKRIVAGKSNNAGQQVSKQISRTAHQQRSERRTASLVSHRKAHQQRSERTATAWRQHSYGTVTTDTNTARHS